MIEVRSISKSFGNITALNDITFTIERGEIFGILGPNGAGKSTIVNILNTLIRPDSGDVIIDGINTRYDGNTVKMIMGVVPQEIALYEELTAYENLLFWGGLYDIPKEDIRKAAVDNLRIVDLLDRKDDRIKTFSGGMKRRINIACSLLHNPRILVMDEPTVGVDPQNRNHIYEVIEKLNSGGMTIIYTTHYMDEAERFCDKMAIIDTGRIIAQGTLRELRAVSDVKDILTVKLAEADIQVIEKIISSCPALVYDNITNTLGAECASPGIDVPVLITKIQELGGVIEKIYYHGTDLESVYLKLTGKELRD